MIIEIHCDKFRQTPIKFGAGLNVVMGDNAASNSIGKSTFLMVIDLMLGGNSFFDHNKDVITELGNHQYFITFSFGRKLHYFCRDTSTPTEIIRCSKDRSAIESITLKTYHEFLARNYGTDSLGASFRFLVSPFLRIWGRDNLDPRRPLDTHSKSKVLDALTVILALHNRLTSLAPLEKNLAEKTEEKKALHGAQSREIVPNIGSIRHKKNLGEIEDIDEEINDIRLNLKRFATNLQQIVSKDSLDIKQSKDILLITRTETLASLRRVEKYLEKNSYIKSKTFLLIKEFFPEVNERKLADIEEFHSAISRILRRELKESQKSFRDDLERIDAEIAVLDAKLSSLLSNVENPSVIIERVQSLGERRNRISLENHFRDQSQALSQTVSELKAATEAARKRQLKIIENQINLELLRLAKKIYGSNKKSPFINFTPSNYSYEIFEDTGTGKAYSNLALFDLSLLRTSDLPFIVHDSPMFKNVENNVVSQIINEYAEEGNQIFIAIDEVNKYNKEASSLIEKNCILRLSNTKVLYIKDWRKQD